MANVYIWGTAFGLSVIVGIGGLVASGMGATHYAENRYTSNPITKTALKYESTSENLEYVVEKMDKYVVLSNDKVIIIEKPDNSELKENLKTSINEIKALEDSDRYTLSLIDIYTKIENLDKKELPDLASKEKYGEEYTEIKKDIGNLSQELVVQAKIVQPDLDSIKGKIKFDDYFPLYLIAGFGAGAVLSTIFGIQFFEELSYHRSYVSKPRRQRNKI